MTLTIYEELEQWSPEWFDARRGLMSASELNLILTPKLKIAENEKTRAHCFELAAQRLNNFTDPSWDGENAMRGWADEIRARDLYSEHFAPVNEIGGLCRDFGAFKLWCSPDGLVGEDGGIEVKSRLQKHQTKTVFENEVPDEHKLQVQAFLLVSGRDWIDYLSYSGGTPLWRIRVEPDPATHTAIMQACTAFEERIQEVMRVYKERIDSLGSGMVMTERNLDSDVIVR